MKLSLAWIFDHLAADWQKVNVKELVAKFNTTTAEIDGVTKISYDLNNLALAQVKATGDDGCAVTVPECKTDAQISARTDAVVGSWYVVKKNGNAYSWVTLEDLQCDKAGLMPAVHCATDAFAAGGWKKDVEQDDYVFDVDNTSITHRPDLWCHRGVAREVAAILNVTLIDQQEYLADLPVVQHTKKITPTADQPFTVSIDDTEGCRRFGMTYLPHVANQGVDVRMAFRLTRLQSRPINAVVDATNYVMQDIGEPMHAYDAQQISTNTVIARRAQKGEKLALLDGQDIELTTDDCVIADGKKAIGLAGIMGGAHSGINSETTTVFVEAATFDAVTVRRTSDRYKIRTEASSRFEKSLDPNVPPVAIARFVKVLQDLGVLFSHAPEIHVLGQPAVEQTITIDHGFLERRLGTQLQPEFVTSTLSKLGFGGQLDGSVYTVNVPTYRFTKDPVIKEDIVEEVGRYFGYINIVPVLPRLQMTPHSLHTVQRIRAIKNQLAFGAQFQEVENYALYDNQFLQELGWQPSDALSLKNPVSEHATHLVTSLIPHVIKNVVNNKGKAEQLRFFELNRVWHMHKKSPVEHKKLSGIIFEKKPLDFYVCKQQLLELFNALSLSVAWQPATEIDMPWWHQYQTARLMHHDVCIGVAGMISQATLSRVVDGHAFAFELDAQYLIDWHKPTQQFQPLSKYQQVTQDVSLFVPLKVTVATIHQALCVADPRITSVELADFFEKPEWTEHRSITMRVTMQDPDKTMDKQEIDDIMQRIVSAAQKQGATVR